MFWNKKGNARQACKDTKYRDDNWEIVEECNTDSECYGFILPVTESPTSSPSNSPSASPSESPSDSPSNIPSDGPTFTPTGSPTIIARTEPNLYMDVSNIEYDPNSNPGDYESHSGTLKVQSDSCGDVRVRSVILI